MLPNPPEASSRPDPREALIYVAFAALLLTLLGVTLWLRSFARLAEVELYIYATVLAGSACLFRADRSWRQSKRIARRKTRIHEKEAAVLRERSALEASTGGSWAKRIREES